MDSARHAAVHSPRARLARRIGWTIAWLALGAISVQFLLAVYGKYHAANLEAYSLFWSRRGWLWTHLAGGALTIALGPLQFLTRWPRAYPRLHRWAGRVYLCALLVACIGATGLIATSPAPFEIRTAFASTALAWLTTALAAILAIRYRHVWVHRRWMIRNYLVTLSPITFRFLLPAGIALGLVPSPTMIASLLWMSWLLPLLIYEVGHRAVDTLRQTRGHTSARRRSGPHRMTSLGDTHDMSSTPPPGETLHETLAHRPPSTSP